jgi:hypothetical protein
MVRQRAEQRFILNGRSRAQKNLMLAARGHGLNGMLISSTMPNGAQRREAVVSCLLMWHKTEKRS